MSLGGSSPGRNWRVRYHAKVASEDLPRVDGAARQRIKSAIENKLAIAPEQFAKPLAYTLAGLWSLRPGPWRVIFALRQDEVLIMEIGHRRDVYRSHERDPDEIV